MGGHIRVKSQTDGTSVFASVNNSFSFGLAAGYRFDEEQLLGVPRSTTSNRGHAGPQPCPLQSRSRTRTHEVSSDDKVLLFKTLTFLRTGLGERYREKFRIRSCCLTRTDSATTERAPPGPASRAIVMRWMKSTARSRMTEHHNKIVKSKKCPPISNSPSTPYRKDCRKTVKSQSRCGLATSSCRRLQWEPYTPSNLHSSVPQGRPPADSIPGPIKPRPARPVSWAWLTAG
jgi:hypothetical protein